MQSNVVIEGVVNTIMLYLFFSVSILQIFRLPSSLPQYIMSCLKQTQPNFLLCVGVRNDGVVYITKWNKPLNYLNTIYNVYCNETDISVQCSS